MSIFILAFSVAAAAYAVRVTITSILARDLREHAASVAAANGLAFRDVRQALEERFDADAAGSLTAALRKDFQLLSYLLRYAATVNVGSRTSEEWLLIANFHALRFTAQALKHVAPAVSRACLAEMTTVVEHFAGVMGRRMAAFSAG
jgi:hypothetical protein